MAKARVTKGIFEAIKIMTKGGASIDECAEYMNVSPATVSRIRAAEDYDEYLQDMRIRAIAYKSKKKEKEAKEKEQYEKPVAQQVEMTIEKPVEQPVPQVVEHRQTVVVQATHYMMEELKQQNELLKVISNKLAFIVEQLM